ncbi:hypothetical protein [Burkholderia ubonensis]|nr:hypothetical protein [Burkholderia ubonensis]
MNDTVDDLVGKRKVAAAVKNEFELHQILLSGRTGQVVWASVSFFR